MLRFHGNEVWRENEKIGWIDGHRLYDRHGNHIASWDGDELFNKEGHRMFRLEGNHLMTESGHSNGHLDEILEEVPSSEHGDMARVAVKTFLGD